MRFLFLVILFIGCSTKTTSPTTAKPETPMKSPYSAEKCLCMKIFDPVCTEDGRNFGNSCEAECQGYTKWKEGSCNSKK